MRSRARAGKRTGLLGHLIAPRAGCVRTSGGLSRHRGPERQPHPTPHRPGVAEQFRPGDDQHAGITLDRTVASADHPNALPAPEGVHQRRMTDRVQVGVAAVRGRHRCADRARWGGSAGPNRSPRPRRQAPRRAGGRHGRAGHPEIQQGDGSAGGDQQIGRLDGAMAFPARCAVCGAWAGWTSGDPVSAMARPPAWAIRGACA